MAAAAVAATAMGLDVRRTAMAMALSVSSAGGVQRAFGSDAKAIQVELAVDAEFGGSVGRRWGDVDLCVLDAWLGLVSDPPFDLALDSAEVVPGGLAVKVYPCCYELQRPIACAAEVAGDLRSETIDRILVWAKESAVQPWCTTADLGTGGEVLP